MRRWIKLSKGVIAGAALALGVTVTAAPLFAQPMPQPGQDPHAAPGGPRPVPGGRRAPSIVAPSDQTGPKHKGPGKDPRASEHALGAQGDPHAGDHGPGPINWVYGLIGEKDGVEPDILYRPKGMPVPFLANLINFAVVVFLGFKYGRKPLVEGLAKRKTDLMREIDEAARVKEAAEERLDEYQEKLDKLDDELVRIGKDYTEQGERDHERILREAKERRVRMVKDAQLLLEQESKAQRAALTEGTVVRAAQAAEQLVKARLSGEDQSRLADEFLKDMAAVSLSGARGAA